MVEKIEKIRLLMAEQRYIEAQQLVEQALITDKSEQLLGLLLEIHILQGNPLPYQPVIEFLHLNTDLHKSLGLIEKLNVKNIETLLLEIKIHEKRGDLATLHQKISDFYLYLYQRKIPRRFDEVYQARKKYFSTDFGLELKEFALLLDSGWSDEAENELKRLIKECFQKANTKNKIERLERIKNVLSGYHFNNGAKIYIHLLHLFVHGFKEKGDFKKMVETILYFEDLDFKAITLSLLHRWELTEIAARFADAIRNSTDYRFIHFEKYHSELKSYFVQPREKEDTKHRLLEEIDLTLEDAPLEVTKIDWEDDSVSNSDMELAEGLKHLEYDLAGWLNLASGFIQSDLNKCAFFCAKKVRELSQDDTDFLKGSYLAVHALTKLKDYRLALDYCYEAVERSINETDLLSFFYLEAELLIKLGDKKSAKKVLDSIMNIDRHYRMSEKMLKRLNEI